MRDRELEELLKRYKEGRCKSEEIRKLEAWYAQWHIKDPFSLNEPDLWEAEKLMARNLRPIKASGRIHSWHYMAAAATILLILSAGILLYRHRSEGSFEQDKITHKEDIPPGGNKAILTLSNGTKIRLDSVHQGVLSSHGSSKVVKLSNGLLSYKPLSSQLQGPNSSKRALLFNTLVTPKGGEFQLILPDGSKVWLNASSSLRFPTAFTAGKREVEVSGEAYFEIAAKAASPFIVKAGSTRIQVLGTDFNIEAYPDENAIRTTLAGGSVKILAGEQGRILRPGEQAAVITGTKGITVQRVNLDEVLAWKNGLFYFDNTNLEEIMRKVARWYDVTIIYQTKDLANKNYSGVLSRYGNVDALLKRLELTGTVHFQINDRTITVRN